MNYCIHAATAWGGADTERINVQRVHELFDSLSPLNLKKIIYFSTASILGKNNELIPEAEFYGTDYIRTKYLCYKNLKNQWFSDRLITVFPTLIFGGDATHPFSNLSLALPMIKKFAWLVGRINIDVSFHIIHAEDIAKMVFFFLKNSLNEKDYVLGNEACTFGQFTKGVGEFFGHHIRFQIPINPKIIYRLVKIFAKEMTKWDDFCAQNPYFQYAVTNCHKLGLSSRYNEIEGILADWKFIPQQKG